MASEYFDHGHFDDDLEHLPAEDSISALSRRNFLMLGSGSALLTGLGLGIPTAEAASQSLTLEQQINRYVQSLRRKGQVRSDERTAWSVFDFTSGKKLVAINEDRSLQAASMIKPFIAQAYFFRHQENSRRFPYTSKTRQKMAAMIRYSNNSATNYFIDRISDKPANRKPKDVERVLKQNAGGIFQHTSIVEYIPNGGRTYKNRASAHDYSRFLWALWNDQLPYSKEIRDLMNLSNKDRIRSGAIPGNTRIYDKTGSTARLCGNMGIVVARGKDGKAYPYTFIGIIEKTQRASNYGPWIRSRGNVLREISAMVYRNMQKRHNLV